MLPMGTTFNRKHGKVTQVCTLVDYYTTTNLKGEIVNQRYVAAHEFMGQVILERDICGTMVLRNLIKFGG